MAIHRYVYSINQGPKAGAKTNFYRHTLLNYTEQGNQGIFLCKLRFRDESHLSKKLTFERCHKNVVNESVIRTERESVMHII